MYEYKCIPPKEMSMRGVNSWLNVYPIKWRHHLFHGKSDFQDALLLRFNKKRCGIPITCAASNCQAEFDLVHSDIYPHGGVINRRHDHIKSILACHAEQAFGCTSVDIEPDIEPLDVGAKEVKDFNGLHSITYFDDSIVPPVYESHKTLTIEKSIANAEKGRTIVMPNESRSYLVGILCGVFSPLVEQLVLLLERHLIV